MSRDLSIPFEKYRLDNGLEVVLHEDHSVPIAAVCVVYHVGSAREVRGRTGFAHLFEHLMFEGSAHVGEGEHFKRISEAGGVLNGSTNRDRTNYYEMVPANHLETALWLEADRMGFLLPAMSQDKLDNQRAVVKNERRQNYENRPYAKALWPTAETLYPSDHPYSWLTIGSHEDLDQASLDDVSTFFRRWYGPNNATLAIGGDFDPDRTREWVQRWFGSIPTGPAVERPAPRPIALADERFLLVEDEVQLPELTVLWPTVPQGHDDEAALEILLLVLSANKSALLDRALTIDEVLCSQVLAHHSGGELAGEFKLSLRAAPNVSLAKIDARVRTLLQRFQEDGVGPEQIQRLRNRCESGFLQMLETVLERTKLLAEFNALFGDPAALNREIVRLARVDVDSTLRVFREYLYQRPALRVSTVPRGRSSDGLSAAANGGRIADTEHPLGTQRVAADRRSVPVPGPDRVFETPVLHSTQWPSGLRMVSTPYHSLPLAALQVNLRGGHLRESEHTAGLSWLTSQCMEEGTEALGSTELVDALDGLGAVLQVASGERELSVFLKTLEKNLEPSLELLADVVHRPRLADADFQRIRNQILTQLDTMTDHPRAIADIAWRRRLYPQGTVAGLPHQGTRSSVAALTLEAVREFHAHTRDPSCGHFAFVGPWSPDRLKKGLSPLAEGWSAPQSAPYDAPQVCWFPDRPLYLIDKPGIAQSEIRIGHRGVPRAHPDFETLQAANYILGGSFHSRINLNLREDKGYTYGAFSTFFAGRSTGAFTVSTSVHTEVTAAAVSEILSELERLEQGFTEEEADYARRSLIQALGRRFESVQSLCAWQSELLLFDLPLDHLHQKRERLSSMSRSDMEAAMRQHVQREQCAILVVGDLQRFRQELEALNLGPIELLGEWGEAR